jgi:hypothetical protein
VLQGSQLLQHAQLVEAVPALHDLAFFREAEDAYSGDRYPFACGGDAPELAGMGYVQRPAIHDLVVFPDHVLDDVFYVREGGAVLRDELLDVVGPRSRTVPSDWWERYFSAKTSSALSSFSSFHTSST